MKLALTGQEKKFLAIKYQKEGLTRKVDINNKKEVIRERNYRIHPGIFSKNNYAPPYSLIAWIMNKVL